ncbi:argininosuccinate lyase [Gemmatimonas aurantiaca]|nr:argininosuccinate lyase [Gemmatimonas aurantiaca]
MAMDKLWQKTTNVTMNDLVERFLSSDDVVFDQLLARFDVLGSLAHIKGLLDAEILTQQEYLVMQAGLRKILQIAETDGITVTSADEDIHTVVEAMLKSDIGDPADKLHTLRSRNDQIAVDIRLYCKQQLLDTMRQVLDLAAAFNELATKNENVPMPGYSHMQKAMVSSVGLWAHSFSASLLDDCTSLISAYTLNDQSPLGSAAGYGSPLPLNREIAAKALGFAAVQENALYCQNSRGKTELAIVHGILQIMHTINKFSADTLLFTMSEFKYFSLPDNFLTGSSIMAQKKNYDVLEMLRAQLAAVSSHFQHITLLIGSLPSGYNRDFQEVKKPLFASFAVSNKSLAVTLEVVKALRPNKETLAAAITTDLLVTNEVYALVEQGVPFREAYRQIGAQYEKGELIPQQTTALPLIDTTLLYQNLQNKNAFLAKEQAAYSKCLRLLSED